jgi:hypothetical protein
MKSKNYAAPAYTSYVLNVKAPSTSDQKPIKKAK